MKINAINSSMFSVNKTHYSKNNVYFTKPLNADYVTFSAKPKTQKIDVDVETAKTVAKALSTSTSGYRAEYGTEKFNKKIVEAITVGVADYAINAAKILNQKPVVMVGGDTRQATKEMIPVICDVLSKKGIDVCIGTIDSNYRGMVMANVVNNSDADFVVEDGDRICQLAIRKLPMIEFMLVDKLEESERGENGFGSTGLK